MWPLRIRRLGCAIVIILALLLPVPARAHPAADPAFTYRLADTWGHVPWQPKAGRFGQTLDITAIPDGTMLVLDGRQETVHVLEPLDEGDLGLLIDRACTELKAPPLDAAARGSFFLLVEGPFASDESEYRRYRIDHLWPDGRMIGSFEVTPQDGQPAVYRDIAVRSDGRVYLSRMDTDEPFFDWSGVMPTPAPPDSPLTRSGRPPLRGQPLPGALEPAARPRSGGAGALAPPGADPDDGPAADDAAGRGRGRLRPHAGL